MPSTSNKQRVAMAIACHNPGKSTSGIPKDVACEFNRADKRKKAGVKVKEAVEYLNTLKIIETLRSMSFTQYLVEDATKKAPNASELIANIQMQAQRAADDDVPGGKAFLRGVQSAIQQSRSDLRLMGAIRARDAFGMASENSEISFEEAEDYISLTEAVDIPDDVSFEQIEKMFKAAQRGRKLADKLKNPEEKKKHKSRITGNYNKLRAKYMKMKKEHDEKITESLLAEWTLSDIKLSCKGKHGEKIAKLQKMAKDNYTRSDLEKVGMGEVIIDIPKKETVETNDALILAEAHKKHKKPSAGLTSKQKSAVVKKAVHGKHVMHGGFKKVEKAARKNGADDPTAVAAAQMWKMKAAKATHENMNLSTEEVDFIVESTLDYQKTMKKLNKVFTEHLDPENYDNQKVIVEVAMEHASEHVDGWEFFTEDVQMELIRDTCAKYGIREDFNDEPMDDESQYSSGIEADNPGDDDIEMDHPGMDYEMGDEPQEIGSGESKQGFKLEPKEIGKISELIAHYLDFPSDNRIVARAVDRLQHVDLFHLSPEESIIARKLLELGGETDDMEGGGI